MARLYFQELKLHIIFTKKTFTADPLESILIFDLEVLLNIWPFPGSLIFLPAPIIGGQQLVQIMYLIISEDAELEEWARGVEVVINNKGEYGR